MKNTCGKLVGTAVLIALGVSAFGNMPVANAQGSGAGNRLQAVAALTNILLDETQKATNLTRADIMKELRTGTSLADVIKAHGATVEAVTAAAKADATAKIQQAVTDGKLTQKQADTMLSRLDQAIDRLINFKWPVRDDRRVRMLRAAAVRLLIRETAREAKITQRDLLQQLRQGKTLAQIATANNADPATIVSAVVTTATNNINKLVSQNKLTQDQANKLIAALPDSLNKLMNTSYPLGTRSGSNNAPATTPQPTGTPSL